MTAEHELATRETALAPADSVLAAEAAIVVRNVGKMYHLFDRPQDRLKHALLWRLGKNYGKQFWALRDLSFEVRRGEALGIIGRNGSGKSTLLQIIAGIIPPTTGTASVRGRVTSLLELGSGFNPEFTGRENVYLNGIILGFSRKEMDARFAEIVEFAEIGDFIDQPVKIYSSGMFVRLAFAVQACLEPEVLIVDEALSVGDIFFQQKCHARMEELLARQTAILLVSHNMDVVAKYCKRALLIDQGRSVFLGRPSEAIQRYMQVQDGLRLSQMKLNSVWSGGQTPRVVSTAGVPSNTQWPASEAFLDISQAILIGDEDSARCIGVALCNSQNAPAMAFRIGEVASFYFEFELMKDIEVPIGGLSIWSKLNAMVHSRNSLHSLVPAPTKTLAGTRLRFRKTVELSLAPGEYTFTVGLATIGAMDYASLVEATSFDYPTSNIVTLLRVTRAGRILILPKPQGASIPFHGYVDLRGDVSLSVLPLQSESMLGNV